VAVLASGNAMGLGISQWRELADAERAQRLAAARERLASAAPDDWVDTVADLLPVIDRIEQRLAAGERPAPPA
jgi:phosphonoacetaldehyde hydrolase